MAQQDFAIGFCAVNGNVLTLINSIERETDSGQQRIDTLQGLSGWTPGSGSVKITIGYLCPIGGTEERFQQMCALGEYVTVQLGWGPSAYVGVGKFLTDKMSQSANAAAEGSINWEGELKPIE